MPRDRDSKQTDSASDEPRFFPTADWLALRRRAEILRLTRAFFDARGFLEVETPLLSADTVVDRHLDPFETLPTGRGEPRRFLQTSPEFAMKRLMAAGGEAIYQVTRAFRHGESGRLHNPEFTIVEWYRRGDDYERGMQLLDELCCALLGRAPAERLTYTAAFERFVGVDPMRADIVALQNAARQYGVSVPASLGDDDRDTWLELLLTSLVEPHLGRDRPVMLCDYPPSQAALARVRDGAPPVAERFELYVEGLELANGYHELLDANVLRQRIEANNAARRADGKAPLPSENRLLAAMEHGLPPCTGVALGLDRVVMLAVGADRIADVLAFPFDRA